MISSAYFIEGITVKSRETSVCVPRIRLGSSIWQNPTNRYDVDNDGFVTLEDYRLLQRWLDQHGEGELPAVKTDSAPYVDVDGDGSATNNDLILLSRWITRGQHEDFTAEECFPTTTWDIYRDLIVPRVGITIREVGVLVKAHPYTDYRAFNRDFRTNVMTEVNPTDLAKVKDSLVFIHRDLFTPLSIYAGGCKYESGIVGRLRSYLASAPEILPSRFLWP